MADIDEMHARGVPFRALVDGQGIAVGGTLTMAQLSSAGMMPVCEVDANGVAGDGSTLLQLRSRGIPFFCEVSELGIDPSSGDTTRTLASRGIRGDCLLTENGIAQGGTATMVELSRRGIDYFCPVDEAGTETLLGPDVAPPVFTSATTGNNPENTVLAFTVTTNEPTTKVITGGADLARFEIVSGGTINVSHTLRWLANTTKDFEAPDDVGTNNTYVVIVTATDAATNAAPQTITITVTDVDEIAPTITSANTANNVENVALAHALTANETVTWTVTGGADSARFEISGSTLRWLGNGVKDFEAPDDVGANNTYVVQVTATDAALNATNQTITVTVTDADEVAPAVFAFSPLDDSTGISPSTNLVVIFDENVQFHTAVVIRLRLTSNDNIVETFDETDIGGRISITGATLTINPTSAMASSTSHYVMTNPTSIKDMAGNFWAGISSKTTWNFTTGVASVVPEMQFDDAANSQLLAVLDDF